VGIFAVLCAVLLCCISAFSQASASFENADVQASAPSRNPVAEGGLLSSGRYELRRATLVDLIRIAYGVEPEFIFGGPDWSDWDRFDITAKVPTGTTSESAKPMLQKFLADRFELAVHRDTKPISGFVLSTGSSKAKLTEADAADDAGCRIQRPGPPRPGFSPQVSVSCRNTTMGEFAVALREAAGDYISSPILDSTGLQGKWNLELKWTPRGPLQAGSGGVSVFDAAEKQLGLQLASGKIPLPVLVVDRVSKPKTSTDSGASAGPATLNAAEFEVASIKPSLSDAPPPPPPERRLLPGGRLNWRGMPLRALIIQAWDLDPDPHADLPGAPKWLDEARFDVIAKAPDGASTFSDDLQAMLRALLVERFGLQFHYEDRPVDTYTLVAVKPRLKRADPSNRPACRNEPPQPPRDPGEGPPPAVTVCRNVTMSQFAERLQGIGRSYIRYPVADGTGIAGSWDFTLSYNPAPPPGPGRGRGGPPEGNPAGPAPPEPGGLTIFAAIQKEFGLKLELHKRTMPVFVIDHIERQPTEN
jgi:uncharacterized protein (TIGR03435 family)